MKDGELYTKSAAFAWGGAFTRILGATACKTFQMLNARRKTKRANHIITETLHISVTKGKYPELYAFLKL